MRNLGRYTFITGALTVLVIPFSSAQTNERADQVVSEQVQAILPANSIGGAAVTIRINGQTLFFNYGVADLAKNLAVTPNSIFNLASVGKLFAATLLAQSVTQGELRLDDPVAKFVPELAQGTDIRRVTLGQLASHTSGLPRVPQNYEERHKGKYTLPDFIRFLKSWKADVDHEPGHQYLDPMRDSYCFASHWESV